DVGAHHPTTSTYPLSLHDALPIYNVHATCFRHGISSLPASTKMPSVAPASPSVRMMPVRISARILRWNPSVNSVPSEGIPNTAPTVHSAIVEAATTRKPVRITGAANGSSTVNRRRNQEYP